MPATEDKIEISSQQTRLWALGGLVGVLLLVVQGFFTFVITSTGTELRETNRGLVELVSTVKVQQQQIEFLRQQMADINEAKKEGLKAHAMFEGRLNSIEQRLALHDQWISAHNK